MKIPKSSKDLSESWVRNLGPMVIANPEIDKNLISYPNKFFVSTIAFTPGKQKNQFLDAYS